MKSNELRIGNKLQKDSGEIFTISRLDESLDVLVKEQRCLLTLGYNLFQTLTQCSFIKSFILFIFLSRQSK